MWYLEPKTQRQHLFFWWPSEEHLGRERKAILACASGITWMSFYARLRRTLKKGRTFCSLPPFNNKDRPPSYISRAQFSILDLHDLPSFLLKLCCTLKLSHQISSFMPLPSLLDQTLLTRCTCSLKSSVCLTLYHFLALLKRGLGSTVRDGV